VITTSSGSKIYIARRHRERIAICGTECDKSQAGTIWFENDDLEGIGEKERIVNPRV
jgi:hypothetical protein